MKHFFTLLATALSIVVAFAQTRPVSGIVTDDKGAVVPFATVSETGTKNMTTANENGAFTINLPAGRSVTITAAGYQPKTATPSGNSIAITMARGEGQLQEVVVTALGIRREKRSLTYATQTIN